ERLPSPAIRVRELDVRKTVVKGVARTNAAVPALRGRLGIPGSVTTRKLNRRTDGFAVQPDAPPPFAPCRLEHLEGVRLARLDARAELDVPRIRAGDCDLVVDPAHPVGGEGAVPDLEPLRLPARAGVGSADADPRTDVA